MRGGTLFPLVTKGNQENTSDNTRQEFSFGCGKMRESPFDKLCILSEL